MKKLIIILTILSSFGTIAQTPNFNELVRQKRTARRYMARQIAELQLYIQQAREGYELVRTGLTTLQNFTNGELNLHTLFYRSLKTISPVIKNHHEIKTIINQQIQIEKLLNDLQNTTRTNHTLPPSQKKLLLTVCKNAKDDSKALTGHLAKILTDNKLQLNDSQRIAEINQLASQSTRQLKLIIQLSNETLALINAQIQESNEETLLNHLYK